MNHQQMRKRCPSSKFVKAVFLEGYKFVYDGHSCRWKGGVANIIESQDGVAWGGLFEINEDHLAALDCYEDYPHTYDRKQIAVKDQHGSTYEAWTYQRTGKKVSQPSQEYRRTVLQGAQDCLLPKKYVETCF